MGNFKVNSSTVIGYCRVSSKSQLDGNSLEQQGQEILDRYPHAKIVNEQFTGKTVDRPRFKEIVDSLENGQTLVVTKLDRFCRNVVEGITTIKELMRRGIKIHILNMGLIEDTPMGDLIVASLLAFSEFERATIVERTQSGKILARQKEGFKEGRPKTHSDDVIKNALSMLNVNGGNYTFKEVSKLTKISEATLYRKNNERKMVQKDF